MGEGDIASIGQRSDTESFLGSQIFVGVGDIPISDTNDTGVFLRFPVESGLFLPFKVVHILTFELHGEISLMHVDRHQCLHLGSINLGSVVLETHGGQELHHGLNVLSLLLEGGFFVLSSSVEGLGKLLGPDDLNSDQGDLGAVSLDEVSELHVEASSAGGSTNISHGVLHVLLELEKPSLDISLTLGVIDEGDGFFIRSQHGVQFSDHLLRRSLLLGVLIKGDFIDGIEELFEIFLDVGGLRSLR